MRVRHLVPALPGRQPRIHAVPSITTRAYPRHQASLRRLKMSVKEVAPRGSLALQVEMSQGTYYSDSHAAGPITRTAKSSRGLADSGVGVTPP
jgi:hypothetical protein